MAKEDQVNGMVRLVNSMIVRMIRWNLAPPEKSAFPGAEKPKYSQSMSSARKRVPPS